MKVKFEVSCENTYNGFSERYKPKVACDLMSLAKAQKLVSELNAREAKLEELQAERDRLRAYAECMKCWRDYCHQVNEDKSDWSKTLRGHGWNPSENGPIEFMDSLLTTALSAKEENQ